MQRNSIAARSRAFALRAWAFACLALLSACADGPDEELPAPSVDAGTERVEAGPAPSTPSGGDTTGARSSAREDTATPAPSSSSSSTPGASSASSSTSPASNASDAGTRPTSADAANGTPSQDQIGSLIDTLLGASDDGGTSGEWKLEPDSAPECPAEPPPIPIIGGACLGIYYFCGWKNPAGDVYTCTCDWVHWLCI